MRLSLLKIYRLLCLLSRHPTRLDIYKILYWVGHTLDYQPCISGVAFQSILHILQLDEGEEWKPKKWCCFCLEFWSESPDWVGQVDVMFSSHVYLSVCLFMGGGGSPCDHYPWCIGPHHTGTSTGHVRTSSTWTALSGTPLAPTLVQGHSCPSPLLLFLFFSFRIWTISYIVYIGLNIVYNAQIYRNVFVFHVSFCRISILLLRSW